jgi:rare lipoprotein A
MWNRRKTLSMGQDWNGTRDRRWWVHKGLLGLTLGLTVTVVTGSAAKLVNETDTSLETAKHSGSSDTQTKAAKKRWFEIGKASWYGKNFNGRRTANGERYDMTAWTCAHRTLPLGSWVKVTNLLNRKTIFLRVNDRGPVPESQIVDLSYAAARKIGISGLGKVRIESVAANDPRLIDQRVASVRPMQHAPWPVELSLAR